MPNLVLPAVRSEWRTPTVVGLCQSMREAKDYSAAPILADALQDADCGDEGLLAELRGPLEFARAATLVACVLYDEAVDAARWMEALAAELGPNDYAAYHTGRQYNQPMDYDVLLTAARNYRTEGKRITQYNNQNWQDRMEGRWVEFWKRYTVLTGDMAGDKEVWGFFSCSC